MAPLCAVDQKTVIANQKTLVTHGELSAISGTGVQETKSVSLSTILSSVSFQPTVDSLRCSAFKSTRI
jgi:hypothetical protein